MSSAYPTPGSVISLRSATWKVLGTSTLKRGFTPLGVLNAAMGPANREDTAMQCRSLLHVAATRAKKALLVSWAGTPTKLIYEQPQRGLRRRQF